MTSFYFSYQVGVLPTLRDFLSLPKAMRMTETKRLMITSTIKKTLVKIRKDPRIGSKAITWEEIIKYFDFKH